MSSLDGVLALLALIGAAGWSVTALRLRHARRQARLEPPPYADGRPVHALAEESARFGVWELDPIANRVHLSAGAARLNGLPPVAVVEAPPGARGGTSTRTTGPRRSGCSRRPCATAPTSRPSTGFGIPTGPTGGGVSRAT